MQHQAELIARAVANTHAHRVIKKLHKNPDFEEYLIDDITITQLPLAPRNGLTFTVLHEGTDIKVVKKDEWDTVYELDMETARKKLVDIVSMTIFAEHNRDAHIFLTVSENQPIINEYDFKSDAKYVRVNALDGHVGLSCNHGRIQLVVKGAKIHDIILTGRPHNTENDKLYASSTCIAHRCTRNHYQILDDPPHIHMARWRNGNHVCVNELALKNNCQWLHFN
jgi:hypothetical protein